MNNPLIVDLFVEDRAHEEFLKPLIARIAREEGVSVSLRVRSARGGHGRAIAEYELYQTLLAKGLLGETLPALMIVAIDGNCSTITEKRAKIQKATKPCFCGFIVIACPDPHVERWYLADPDSFYDVVGCTPMVAKRKCVRDYYKNLLISAVKKAGHPITLGGVEFAPDLAAKMDLYRAGRDNPSLKAFVGELRGRFKQACKM